MAKPRLTIEWWNSLEDQWKKAFNEAFWNKGSVLDAPSEAELVDISTTPTLRIVGPEAPFPNCSFELTNLSGCSELTTVETFVVTFHQIESIKELSKHTKLNAVFLISNKIKSLEGLEHATAMRDLYVQDNQIESLAPIANLSGLKLLNCVTNKLSKVELPPNIKEFYCLPNENITDREVMRIENDLGIRCRKG